MLHSEIKLSKQLDDSQKSNIDCCMERPSASFCIVNCSVLNDFCYSDYLAYYALANKSGKTCKYQIDEFGDNLFDNNHEGCSYPEKIETDNFRRNIVISQSKTNLLVPRAK